MNKIPHFSFYGLKVSSFTKTDLLQYIHSSIKNKAQQVCYGYSFGIIPYIKRYPSIYKMGEQSDLLVTDGRPYYLLIKRLHFPVKYEISIPNLVQLLLKTANQKNYRVYLLGGTNKSNNLAVKNTLIKYPGIKALSGHNGYFKEDEETTVVNTINATTPDIVLVGITSPKKDDFTIRNRYSLQTGILVPCGGMIEVLAGNVKQPPNFIKKIGFASVYRVIQEPKRLVKRYVYLFSFLFLRFFPAFLWQTIVLKNKAFSIPGFCGIKS